MGRARELADGGSGNFNDSLVQDTAADVGDNILLDGTDTSATNAGFNLTLEDASSDGSSIVVNTKLENSTLLEIGDTGTITAPMLDGGQTGSAPALAVRAYVNINGTDTTASIAGSVNVSSVTDNGVGHYTVNFTTNMTANTYAVASGGSSYSAAARNIVAGPFSYETSNFQVRIETSDGDAIDQDNVSMVVVI